MSAGAGVGRHVDFGRTAEDYRRHRRGFPPELFDRLAAFGIDGRGARVLDLGTGTGALARGFALRGGRVVGIDPAAELLEQARELDRGAGVSVEYRTGRAEETGLPAGAFDAVVAGQAWHWFDRERAAREVRRLLRPGGAAVITHFDWLPLPGNVVEATERLILRHNPSWGLAGGTGIYPAWLTDLATAGFHRIESFSFDVSVAFTHEEWRGRIRASAGVGASLPPAEVSRFDVEHAHLLSTAFPGEPLLIPHRVFAAIGMAPAEAPPRTTATSSPGADVQVTQGNTPSLPDD